MEWFLCLLILNFVLFIYIPLKWIYTPTLFTCFLHVVLLMLYMKWRPKECAWFKNFFHSNLNFNFCASNVPESDRRILYVLHPHGVYAVSLLGYFPFSQSPPLAEVAVSSILFRLPLVKDFCGLIGIKTTVKREELLAALKTGSVAMCPGGLRELLNNDGKWVKRKGFIKLAKEADACICLVTCPDEETLYNVYICKCLYPIQDWFLRKFLYPFPIFSWSSWFAPFWPRYLPLRLIFGKLIETRDRSVDEIFRDVYREEGE